jgi:bifunctional non-homologous end joining protein LigD
LENKENSLRFDAKILYDRLPKTLPNQHLDEGSWINLGQPIHRATLGYPYNQVMGLREYHKKRTFSATPEPSGRPEKTSGSIFVVQRHDATRLHYDFRLQIEGTLKSWAVPKGPPLNPSEKRLAIHVEDHPVEYARFEGTIPQGNYGAGEVEIWDQGTFEAEGDLSAGDQVRRGEIKFRLHGQRLQGSYALVKMRNSQRENEWLFLKHAERNSPGAGSAQPPPSISDSGGRKETASRPSKARPSPLAQANPAKVSGAKSSPMPSDVKVALATLAKSPFSDAHWLFEIKWDGERALAYIRKGEHAEFRSRSGRDITHQFPELRALPKQLKALEAIVDGEIVALDESGRSDFQRLQNRFLSTTPPTTVQRAWPATYYIFDILYCDGYDLRQAPLTERKHLLEALLETSNNIRFSDHQMEKGEELYELARKQGLEGILAKQAQSPYASGRTHNWLKLKIVQEVDVIIGGWTAPRKTRAHLGALLMGIYKGEDLIYIGSVGTGFSNELLTITYDRLRKIETIKCPFAHKPKLSEPSTWVKPEIVARVKYGMWTSDSKLRQPVFIAFRDDISARECQIEGETPQAIPELPAPKPRSLKDSNGKGSRTSKGRNENNLAGARPSKHRAGNDAKDIVATLEATQADGLSAMVNGNEIKLTHLNKVYFPENGYTKKDLLLYYARMAQYILPFLKDRAMVLRRYPNGIHGQAFFQKEAPSSRPAWLKTASIYSKERKGEMPYVMADDTSALLYLTNLGCIDHNPWSNRVEHPDQPDYIFFDLDPTDGTPYAAVLKVASAIHRRLESIGMRTYLKTSGASGFHIYVPLEPRYTYNQVREFAGAIAQLVERELPKLVTREREIRKRPKGRTLIDTLQNARGKPLACPYSIRPFPAAPISAPVSADELSGKLTPETWNIATLPARLKKRGDLWSDFWDNRKKLEDAVERFTAQEA